MAKISGNVSERSRIDVRSLSQRASGKHELTPSTELHCCVQEVKSKCVVLQKLMVKQDVT